MSKKTVVNEIIDLYDECEMLKNKIEYLINKYEKKSTEESAIETKESLEEQLNEKAKNKLFNSVFRDWNAPVEVKEDGGVFNFLTYEQWEKALTREAFYRYSDERKILEEMPLSRVIAYFKKQLHEYYTKLHEYYTKKVNDKKMEIVRSKKENKDE